MAQLEGKKGSVVISSHIIHSLARLRAVIIILSIILGLGGMAIGQEAPSSRSGSAGGECRVTSGPNKGKTGTYSDDGWCEGDWGGTECVDSQGTSNGKCEDAASSSPSFGDLAVFDGNGFFATRNWPAEPKDRHVYGSNELVEVLRNGALKNISPVVETKIVGAVRLSTKDRTYVEIADRNGENWISVPLEHVKIAHAMFLPAIRNEGQQYPILSIVVTGSEYGDEGPPVVTYLQLSPFQRIPRLVNKVAISDSEWDSCVDRYLDCQIDCQNSGGGIFGSVDGCLGHCDDVFDACTFDPF